MLWNSKTILLFMSEVIETNKTPFSALSVNISLKRLKVSMKVYISKRSRIDNGFVKKTP